jgi:uncharacterized Tic20 family protein
VVPTRARSGLPVQHLSRYQRPRGRRAPSRKISLEKYMMDNSVPVNNASGDKTLAILVHIGAIFFSWLAPLVVYLIKKGDADTFTTDNAREALNVQISVLIMYFVCFILSFVLIGLFLFWIVALANLILSIVAAVKASNGVVYSYPMTIRLIK